MCVCDCVWVHEDKWVPQSHFPIVLPTCSSAAGQACAIASSQVPAIFSNCPSLFSTSHMGFWSWSHLREEQGSMISHLLFQKQKKSPWAGLVPLVFWEHKTNQGWKWGHTQHAQCTLRRWFILAFSEACFLRISYPLFMLIPSVPSFTCHLAHDWTIYAVLWLVSSSTAPV